jgi:hypothetical protein
LPVATDGATFVIVSSPLPAGMSATSRAVNNLMAMITPDFGPIAATLFYAALRIGEALALTWRDVDFDDAVIAVPGTKTEASRNTVPLLPALARELRSHRNRQAERGLDRSAPTRSSFRPGAAARPAAATFCVPSSGPPTRPASTPVPQNQSGCTTSGTARPASPSSPSR